MSVFAYARRLADRNRTQNTFDPTFGVPVTQAFGDVAAEGVSEDFARADHRHGMPNLDSFTDDLETSAVWFNDFMFTSVVNDIKILGTVAFGGRDDVSETGAFGSLDATSGLANGGTTGSAAIYVQNTTGGQGGNTNTASHPYKRSRSFLARVRPVINTTHLATVSFACGHILTTTNGDVTTITDGVYFTVTTNGAGAGSYHIIAKNNTSTTDIDTGVSPRTSGTDVLFDIFQITFDGTTAIFFLNNVNVGSISTNIPPATRKTAGFGAFITNGSILQRTMVVDVIAWTGLRSYTE